MSYSRRPKAGGRRERLTNTSINASGARDVETTNVVSNKTDTTVVDQRSAGTGTTDSESEMSIADAVDEDCDSDESDTSTATNLHIQPGSGDPEKGLDAVVPFIERDPDNVTSTLEWRGRVLHSQEVTQVTSSHLWHVAEERWRASLEIGIELIRQHYHEQESILEGEVVEHEQRYKWAIKQLEKEKDEEDYSVTVVEWWEVQSDYQPTGCGKSVMPEPENIPTSNYLISLVYLTISIVLPMPSESMMASRNEKPESRMK